MSALVSGTLLALVGMYLGWQQASNAEAQPVLARAPSARGR
jgi:hypothetical protein